MSSSSLLQHCLLNTLSCLCILVTSSSLLQHCLLNTLSCLSILVVQVILAKTYVSQHCDRQLEVEVAPSRAALAHDVSKADTPSSLDNITPPSLAYSRGAVDLVIAAALQVTTSNQPEPAIVNDCAICMSQVTGDEDAVTIDSCDHSYHLLCIAEWSKVTNNCPLCKRQYCKATRLRDGFITTFQHRKQRHRGNTTDDAAVATQYAEDSGSDDADDSNEDIVCMVRAICLQPAIQHV
jgi:Ring finger domain